MTITKRTIINFIDNLTTTIIGMFTYGIVIFLYLKIGQITKNYIMVITGFILILSLIISVLIEYYNNKVGYDKK